MAGISRRTFCAALGAFAVVPFDRGEPEIILHNANIWTVNPHMPRAQAVAIGRGGFMAVGSNREVLALAAGGARKIDLGGKIVLPGFIDAHSHPGDAGRAHLVSVDCDLRSIAAILDALRQRAAKTLPGQWVIGFKYDDTKTSDGRALLREDLDTAVPDRPTIVEHRGGHTAWINSAGFKAAAIDENTPDPPGGQYDRDPATHRFTGHLRETAKDRIMALLPQPKAEDYRAGVKLISKMMSRSGITSVHDAEASPEDLLAYQEARDAGDLGLRIYCFIYSAYIDRMIAAGIRTGLGDEWVRVGGCKMVADGSISERTARVSQPYVGRPNDFGILRLKEDEHYAIARKAHAAGWQLGTHANGDVAIDQTLRVYERVQHEMPQQDARYRIEHCTIVNDGLVQRMKELGAIPTPFSTYVYYHGEKMREYGQERLNLMFALRSFIDAGIRPTQASDYPPGPFEPMMALQSEVTRTDTKGNVWGPRQKITLEEAIRVGTLHGAHASFEEATKGSIAVGKLADLVVVGRDPWKEDPSTLVSIPIERTMCGGRWTYES